MTQSTSATLLAHVQRYQSFIFDSYSFDRASGKIELRYSLDGEVEFVETITLPENSNFARLPARQEFGISNLELESALFLLHLFGGMSYFKTCCPKKIEVRSGALTEEQAAFWNTVYTKGLGQFFFENQIDFRGLIEFPISAEPPSSRTLPEKKGLGEMAQRILIPVGGGKDSVVTIEKLRKEGADLTLFRMGSHPIIDQIAKVADLPLLTVKRQLPQKLFKLNEEGALNGHVPITGYLSALTIVIALLYEFDTVAMSNEKSASEGNVQYLGEEINHQWSKGEEFEQMFRAYLERWVTTKVQYVNPLRQMTELKIAGEFVKYPHYFSSITSCNTNWKILKKETEKNGAWCGTCPKCAFVFALFAAYMEKKTVVKMFGKNLLEDATLLPLFRQLLGIEGCKPFECVGTAEEMKEAFRLIHERGEYKGTPVLQLYLSQK